MHLTFDLMYLQKPVAVIAVLTQDGVQSNKIKILT